MQIIIDEKALITGLRPTLIFEKIKTGNVVLPGPDRKLAITRSSKDIAKANSQLEMMELLIWGNVMPNKIFNGLAPRLIAASSMLGSHAIMRVLTRICT